MTKTFSDFEHDDLHGLMKLKVDDLKALCENYKVEPKGKKTNMVGRLLPFYPKLDDEVLNKFTVEELKELCAGVDEEKTGNKKDLVARLVKLKGTGESSKRKRDGDDDDEEERPKKKSKTTRAQDFVKNAKTIKVTIDGTEYEAKPKNFNKGVVGWQLSSKDQKFSGADETFEKAEIKLTIQAKLK